MARNVCMNKVCDNIYNIGKSSVFNADSSVNYVETYIANKSFYNGVNYLPSGTEKENLTVMSNVKNTSVKKDYKGLFLNDMENDLLYQTSISFGSTICGLKCEDSFKENSKLHNSQKGLKYSHSDNLEGEGGSDSYRPCFAPSSTVLSPSGHMSQTYQNYISEKLDFEMVADSLTFSPFQERKGAVVRLASEGSVARSTLVDVNYTASKSGKCTGNGKEFSERLCRIVKSINEYGSDISATKTCLEFGSSVTKESVVSDTVESFTEHCNENKGDSFSVPLKKLNEKSPKSKRDNLSKSDSCLDFRFTEQTLGGSLSCSSLKDKSRKNGNQKCSFGMSDSEASPRKSKAKKKCKKTESLDYVTQNQNLTSERDMPQLIPLSDVSGDVQTSKNMELDDGITNVPDSPEMPVLIPFTSENEEPPPNKTGNCSLDYAEAPVPSTLPKMRSPKGKTKSSKVLPKKTTSYSKMQAPLPSSPRGPLYLNYDNIFQPKVVLTRLSRAEIKQFCRGNCVKDIKLYFKANCVKKKTVRKVHRKKCAKKHSERDKNIRTDAEQKFDKSMKVSTEKKFDIVKTESVSKRNCESVEENEDIDEKPLCELKSDNKSMEALYEVKKESDIESFPKLRRHNEKEIDLALQYTDLITENSEDPEVDVIDGINFFSFHTKKSMDEFSETHGGTFSCFSDAEEFDSNDSFGEHMGMIIPTKTTDITQIKGWRNKYFAPEASFIKSEGFMSDSLFCTSDIDEDSFEKPEVFSPRQITSSTPLGSPVEGRKSLESVLKIERKPLESFSQTGSSKSAFVSDALENFLKNESKLQVSFLEKINPNISPIPPNASILSLGSLRKCDHDSVPHLSARHSKILNGKNFMKQFEGDTSESSMEVSPNSSEWNSLGKDSEHFHLKVSKQEKYASPVPKKKIKLESQEETPNPQRLVLKLQKQGCGNTNGYKVADISNASTDIEDSSLNRDTQQPIKECADGCSLPLIQKTMFTCEMDKKLLCEFLGNLNSCEKDLDTINRKSNKVHFDCPVINEKHIRKTLSTLPHPVKVKSLVKKTSFKAKSPAGKVVASPKIIPHTLVSHAAKLSNVTSGSLNLPSDPRGKRRIRLPARYLDSALIVAGSEWVSPVSDNFENDSSRKLKKRKTDCAEEVDSSGDAISEENIREQFPNAKWSTESNSDETDVPPSLISPANGCIGDCSSASCSRTLIYSVFSKKLLCKCEEPKINEEIFSKKIAKSLRSKPPASANTTSATSAVSIGDDHSYSFRDRVQITPASGDKTVSSESNCNQAASTDTASVPCTSEEKHTDLQNSAENIQSSKSDLSLPLAEDTKKSVHSVSLPKEESCAQKLYKEFNNSLSSVSDGSVPSKSTVSQTSVRKEVPPNLLKTDDAQNTGSGKNEATNSLQISQVSDTIDKNVASTEQALKMCGAKDFVKSVNVTSPERGKYALVLVPVKSPVRSQQNCIQGKYIKVAGSPAKLPPNVSVLSGTSLSVLKKCSTANSPDGVNLLTKSVSACRAIGTVSVPIGGNLKTQLVLNTSYHNVNSSNVISSSSVTSANSIPGNSVKLVSQELLQNTLTSNTGGKIVPDTQFHSNDASKCTAPVCSSIPANSGDNLINLPACYDNLLPKSDNTSLASAKNDAKSVPEKSSLKHIQLASLKLGSKVVLYPNKSVMNVKLMNNSSLCNKPCLPSVSGNPVSLSSSEQTSTGPTVVMVSPSSVKNTSLSDMDTTSSTSLHSPQKIVDVSETVPHNSSAAANENSASGSDSTPESCSEHQGTSGNEHHSESELTGNDSTSKDSQVKTENENVDVVTVEDDFDVLHILKKDSENVTLSSSGTAITVEDGDISDDSESDEESGEKSSGSSATDRKTERERKRRQQISEAAEILKSSSRFFSSSGSLHGLLKAAVVYIKKLQDLEVRLKYIKYSALCYRSQVLGNFRKLALEASPEVRKGSVLELLTKLRSSNLLNPRVCGNAVSMEVKNPISGFVKFCKQPSGKPFSDDGCNLRIIPEQENSEGDFKNCQKPELNQKYEGVSVDVKKVRDRKQVWTDSCKSRFTPVLSGSSAQEIAPVLSGSTAQETAPEVSSLIVKDSPMSRTISVELKNALEGKNQTSSNECKPEVPVPVVGDGCSKSSKEGASSNIKSSGDCDHSGLNINALAVDLNESSNNKEKSLGKITDTDSRSQREFNEQINVNIHSIAEEPSKKEKLPSKSSEAATQKHNFPGLIPLIDAPHIRKQILESNRNISIRPLQSSCGISDSEKILCQTRIFGEDCVKKALGGPSGNLTIAGVSSHKSVNNHAHKKSKLSVGETKTLKDRSNSGTINFPHSISQAKVESPHLRGLLSSSSSYDVGVNVQVPSEARTMGLTAPPTFVPILSGPYGLQKVNLNNGKTVIGYKQRSRCDYSPSKNTTIRQIILPPPVSQVVKNPMNSLASSASFEGVIQSPVSVTQFSAFPDIKTNFKLTQSRTVATQPCTYSDIKTKLSQSSTFVTQPCKFSGITDLKPAQSNVSGTQLCTFSGVTTDFKHTQSTVITTHPSAFHGVMTDLTTLSSAPVPQPCIFPGVVTDFKPQILCESKSSPPLEPLQTEPVLISSGENVKRSASPSCDDVPVWVSTETGEQCVVTRISSDEEDSNLGSHTVPDEFILPTIVSCSTISEEKFYQGVDEENV